MNKKGLEFIALALAMGVILWIVDAFLDYVLFYHMYNSFLEILIADMPARSGLKRAVVVCFFLIFGMIVARYVADVEETDDEDDDSDE